MFIKDFKNCNDLEAVFFCRRDPDTLDKTVWGFRLWIRFKFSNGRHIVTSPFANLLAATAKSFETAIQTSFNGAHKTEEEVECNVLLKSRLLQVIFVFFPKKNPNVTKLCKSFLEVHLEISIQFRLLFAILLPFLFVKAQIFGPLQATGSKVQP